VEGKERIDGNPWQTYLEKDGPATGVDWPRVFLDTNVAAGICPSGDVVCREMEELPSVAHQPTTRQRTGNTPLVLQPTPRL